MGLGTIKCILGGVSFCISPAPTRPGLAQGEVCLVRLGGKFWTVQLLLLGGIRSAQPGRVPQSPVSKQSGQALGSTAGKQFQRVSHEPAGDWAPQEWAAAWAPVGVRPVPAPVRTARALDGCQEFPMSGAGGEVWATGPGQWGGHLGRSSAFGARLCLCLGARSARACVRLAQCAWRRGSGRPRTAEPSRVGTGAQRSQGASFPR